MSFSKNSSSSSSSPLTAEERQKLYDAGMSNITAGVSNGLNPTYSTPDFTSTDYASPGEYQAATYYNLDPLRETEYTNSAGDFKSATYNQADPYATADYSALSGGDYDRLEQQILESTTAGLDRAKSNDATSIDADLAKRGIWSSGLAVRALDDLSESYATAYKEAGGEAAAQRYGMEQEDLTNLNNFNLAQTQGLNALSQTDNSALNSFNLAQSTAQNEYNQTSDAAQNSFNLSVDQALNDAALANNQSLNSFSLAQSADANAWMQAAIDAQNSFNLSQNEQMNNFNTTQAQNQYTAAWQPLSYYADLWNQTNGTNSSSSSSGYGVDTGFKFNFGSKPST